MDIPETLKQLGTQDRPKINKAQIHNRENSKRRATPPQVPGKGKQFLSLIRHRHAIHIVNTR